jgi:hypothetical protein
MRGPGEEEGFERALKEESWALQSSIPWSVAGVLAVRGSALFRALGHSLSDWEKGMVSINPKGVR